MRKLSMRGKQRKSDTSESDSTENGVGAQAVRDELSAEHEVSKTEKKQKKNRRSISEPQHRAEDETESKRDEENGSPNKKRKKDESKLSEQKASTSENEPKSEQEQEYEVAKLIAQRTIKGRRQFLVRWKGYNEDADTWELEKNLSCAELIEEFLSDATDNDEVEKSPLTPKSTKDRKSEKVKTMKNQSKTKTVESVDVTKLDNRNNSDEENEPESKEYEVEKILEVHTYKKKNKREFLIRWKGFTPAEDTWEPEENLNCPELIAKFMEKVEKAKTTDPPELRTNPTHTKRYTLMSTESGRRLSRRNKDKQRASSVWGNTVRTEGVKLGAMPTAINNMLQRWSQDIRHCLSQTVLVCELYFSDDLINKEDRIQMADGTLNVIPHSRPFCSFVCAVCRENTCR